MFCHDFSYNIRFIFTNTKSPIFRILTNHSIPNTPVRCSNFIFSIEGLSNLNCLLGRVGKADEMINCRLTLETIRFKVIR